MTPLEQYYELSFYTLAHRGGGFIHQHIVDAFAAQHADENSKPIALFYGLAGLYLYLERGYTGRQVQLAHLEMTGKPKDYPRFVLPLQRGDITVADVLAMPPGPSRDEKIRQWCVVVWDAYAGQREEVVRLTQKLLELPELPDT